MPNPILVIGSSNTDMVVKTTKLPAPGVALINGDATRLAAGRGLRVILNPAPAQALPAALFGHLFMIIPNESEAELLTGIRVMDESTAEQAAQKFYQMGVANVVITLGAKGVYLSTPTEKKLIETERVTAVDTTAAGDCFNGALAVAIAEGQMLPAAVRFACWAAARSVTRTGAQASMPLRADV